MQGLADHSPLGVTGTHGATSTYIFHVLQKVRALLKARESVKFSS